MNVEEVAAAILALYKQYNYGAGSVLIPQVLLEFHRGLSPPEQERLDPALHRLEILHYIRIVEREYLGACYELTQEGYNHVYQNT
jgi:hypothetical protein